MPTYRLTFDGQGEPRLDEETDGSYHGALVADERIDQWITSAQGGGRPVASPPFSQVLLTGLEAGQPTGPAR